MVDSKFMQIRSTHWDKILILSLVLALVFSLFGISWGKVESWNVDQIAMRDPLREGSFSLHPDRFDKPPFHTYVNLALSLGPLKGIQKILGLSDSFFYSSILIWCRCLTALMFLGSVILVFKISERSFGIYPARIMALLFSTSAGLIAYTHFLTADIPVMFWMLVACYFAQNILLSAGMRSYLLAGFFTGIATATKYNGLAIGITIVAAHLFARNNVEWGDLKFWKAKIFNKPLILSMLMVLAGFLIGNPYALIDSPKFLSDFLFNYKVAPVYEGILVGNNYYEFILLISELIGYPLLVVLLLSLPVSFVSAFNGKTDAKFRYSLLCFLSVFLLYYIKFGSFPLLLARWILPVVPYFIFLSGPFWNAMKKRPRLSVVLVSALMIYNLVCAFFVGKRFSEDPRTAAQNWVVNNVSAGSTFEVSHYSPQFNLLPKVDIELEKMPNISGRDKLFRKLFKDDTQIVSKLESRSVDDTINWYTAEALAERKPDYIAINDRYYGRFFSDQVGALYPQMNQFFSQLLKGELAYQPVFDKQSEDYPGWAYPKQIDFLENRMIIFKKTDRKSE